RRHNFPHFVCWLCTLKKLASRVHGGLRKLLTTNVRIHMNHLCRSCTASNCKELAVQPDLNGFLVSGASLKVKRNTNILE
ncbi:Os03g0754200, partial [Oryza sativa Japonica Group]